MLKSVVLFMPSMLAKETAFFSSLKAVRLWCIFIQCICLCIWTVTIIADYSHRYFRLRKRDWKRVTRAKSRCTFMREPSMLEWLAPSWRSLAWPWQKKWSSKELSLGREETSEHGSTKFCAFCPSTTSEYSKSCLWVLTLTKTLPQRVDTAM